MNGECDEGRPTREGYVKARARFSPAPSGEFREPASNDRSLTASLGSEPQRRKQFANQPILEYKSKGCKVDSDIRVARARFLFAQPHPADRNRDPTLWPGSLLSRNARCNFAIGKTRIGSQADFGRVLKNVPSADRRGREKKRRISPQVFAGRDRTLFERVVAGIGIPFAVAGRRTFSTTFSGERIDVSLGLRPGRFARFNLFLESLRFSPSYMVYIGVTVCV